MFTKLVRIGRDAEMKTTPTGTVLLEVSVVYDIGYGDNKKGQWVKLAMFGERAQKLVSHFTKGKQIVVSMYDVKSEAWIKDGEAKSGMSAKIADFSFVSDGQGGQPQQQQQPQQMQQPQMTPKPQQQQPAYQAPPVPQQQPAPQQAAPQQQSCGNAPAQQPAQPAPQAQYAPPSNDFDDDIPF